MLEDKLSDEDLEWLKSRAEEGPQDEEWWDIAQFNETLKNWEGFNEAEKEESDYLQKYGEYCAYVFANADYHIALFRRIGGNEHFISLDDNFKPFKTLRHLDLVLQRFIQKYANLWGGPLIINKVPGGFNIQKYRPLYGFEIEFILGSFVKDAHQLLIKYSESL